MAAAYAPLGAHEGVYNRGPRYARLPPPPVFTRHVWRFPATPLAFFLLARTSSREAPESPRASTHPAFALPRSRARSSRRKKQDAVWSWVLLAVVLATAAGGVLAYQNKSESPDAAAMRSGGACSAPSFHFDDVLAANEARFRKRAMRGDGPSAGLGETPKNAANADGVDPNAPFDADAFQRGAVPWLGVALGASFFLGLAMLWLFRQCAHTMVWTVVYAKVGVMAALAVAFLAMGSLIPGVIFALLTALTAFCFYLWTDELNLVASLLSVSTQGLRDNPHIITTTVGLSFGSLVYIVPAAFAMTFAFMNGSVAVSSAAVSKTGAACADFAGDATDCCAWQVDAWVPFYTALATVSFIWVTSFALETRLYVIGGTMCQWYFAPAGTTEFRGLVGDSLRNALGPSFGTIAFGSFVLTMVEIGKAAAERMRRDEDNRGNILVCLVTTCLECIYAIIEYISKFATLQAAMTGAAFCDAAANVTDLLQRNFLAAYGAYAFPGMILQGTAFVLAGGFGVATWLLSYATFAVSVDANAGLYAALVGALAGVVAFVVLMFFVMIMLNVVDAVFLCYAMDKDQNQVHHREFHAVFEEVNQKAAPQGAVVQNPSGNRMYAAV